MARALFRTFLILVLVLTLGAQRASAQTACPSFPCPSPPNSAPPSRDSNDKTVWYVVGGIAAAALGAFIAWRLFPDPERGLPPEPPSGDPPPVTPVNLPPPGGGAGAPGAGKSAPKVTTTSRKGFNLPPPGARFVANEVILDVPPNVSEAQLNAIAGRHAMTRMETQTFRLTGRRLFRWRIDGGTSVPDMIRSVSGENLVAGAQPNYLFPLAQAPLPQMNSDQYAPERLNLPEAHKLATGNRVLVAVIDSGIDASHEDLAGAVVQSFNAAAAATKDNGGSTTASTGEPHAHGTGMAGALTARRNVLGTAPRVGILAVRAFDPRTHSGEGTTFNIIKGIEWAADNGARIINMSFAGPADPRLADVLDRAARRGIVLIAAAGNAGPNSPPLFPAADKNVIAVTATDMEDRVYTGANRGNHIAVAAPGVDVLVPAPGGSFQFTTGTSVAAAHVSGVVALLLERNPKLTPAEVRRILTRTAKSIGPRDRTGAGLVNAYQAVANATGREAAAPKAAPKQAPASSGQR
ncbi:MAG: S8 family serine peptidase [Xanthobacteraceae bacterium]|nr:S8 family serine peptidase [Xanthobacteraceae bacterium]